MSFCLYRTVVWGYRRMTLRGYLSRFIQKKSWAEAVPEQKAIIISGFAETDEVKKAQELGAGRYIKKPVTLEKLGLAVKKELEK